MKFSCTFLALRATLLLALIVSFCILNIVYKSQHASSQSSIMSEDQASLILNGHIKIHSISDNTRINPDRHLHYFNASTGSSSKGQWVPFGDAIKGKLAYDWLGFSVATSKSGNFFITGSVGNTDNYAQVFEFKEATQKWEQIGGDIPGEESGDFTGWSVDINNTGDVVIIGGIGIENPGHARVYRLIDGQWVKQGQDFEGNNNRFGISVAISGDGRKVIIGDPLNGKGGFDSGCAQVFEYSSDTQKWEQVGGDIIGNQEEEYLGSSVNMNIKGDVIIIGAPGNDGNGPSSGVARVYRLIDGQWVKQGQDLKGKEGNSIGSSVAISGDGGKVIIGGPSGSGNSGRAKVLDYNAETQKWEMLGSGIIGEEIDDTFGSSVDINNTGDVVIIGAPKNSGNGYRAGHARVYRLIDGKWVQQGQDLDGKGSGQFGWSVAISGDGEKVIIGEPFSSNDKGAGAGQVSAFIFKPPQSCGDSPLKILTGETKESAKSCQVIAKKPKKFCVSEQIKTHCPNTCGTCNEFGNSDSIGKFIYKNQVRDCKWLRGKFVISSSKFLDLCENKRMSATCREACNLICSITK